MPQQPPSPAPPAGSPDRQVLIYSPDGPLGGTFTCTGCGVQAWQPDLLDHAAGCRYGPPAPNAAAPRICGAARAARHNGWLTARAQHAHR